MTDLLMFIGKLHAADPHGMGRPAKRLTVAGILVAFVAVFVPGGGATADPVSDTQGQIAALQAQIGAGATQIHALTERFEQANLQASSLGQQLTSDTATLAAMNGRLAAQSQALSGAAVRQYTGEQSAAGYGAAVGGTDPAVRAEYLEVATGNVSDSLDQLKVARQQVTEQRLMVDTEAHQAQSALGSAAAARRAALDLAATEQDRLGHLQTVLAGQVQAKATAQAAAAKQAAATQGAPVNNGLVAAVQSVVGAAAPAPAVPATPAPTAAAATPAATTTTTTTVPPATSSGDGAGGNWLRLRECESGDNYQENTGNGFYGAYQFSAQTWSGLGYPGRPDQEPAAMQDAAAMKLQAQSGWGQWPACSAALGLS